MSTIIDQQIGLAISGDATPQEALDNAVEECNKLLAQ
jgi:multiple sugar transport system substrate-binding protein